MYIYMYIICACGCLCMLVFGMCENMCVCVQCRCHVYAVTEAGVTETPTGKTRNPTWLPSSRRKAGDDQGLGFRADIVEVLRHKKCFLPG